MSDQDAAPTPIRPDPAALPAADALDVLGSAGGREGAYHLWAYKLGRSAPRTAEQAGVPLRTVQRWVSEWRWAERADAEAWELVRAVRQAAGVRLFAAVDDAIAGLRRVANGQGDTRTVVTKDGEKIEVTDQVPYQARVNAQQAILDATILAGRQGAAVEPDRPADADAVDTTSATVSEMAETQRRIRERGRRER